jgi:hypothetical protein
MSDDPVAILSMEVPTWSAPNTPSGTASNRAVVRCCQHLGFKGFQDLKIALARDSLPSVRRIQADISDADQLGT